MPSAICTPAGCRAAASRRCAITPSFAIAKARRFAGFRRWSPPSPAMTAPSWACSAPGSIRDGPPRRASHLLARRSGGSSVMRSASAPPPATASLRSSSARGSRRCCPSSPPCRRSAPRRRSPPAASARSRLRPASRAWSSRGTTIRTARWRPNASPGAARGPASPPRSSSPSATISTTTSSRSARPRCAPGSPPLVRLAACPGPRSGGSGGRAE